MSIILHLILSTIAVMVAGYLIPGITITGWVGALFVAVVLGVLNTFLKPILIFLTLPATILTLGLFALVVNTFIILLTSWLLPDFFRVASFWSAFFFGIVLFFVNAFFALF